MLYTEQTRKLHNDTLIVVHNLFIQQYMKKLVTEVVSELSQLLPG